MNDTYHPCRINLEYGRTDAVICCIDWNFATVGRIERQIYIVHAKKCLWQLVIKLDKDFFRHHCVGRHIAKAAAKDNFAIIGDIGGFMIAKSIGPYVP